MAWFVVSDLHLGDQGVRDNFRHPVDKLPIFNVFLDYVERERGKLIIAGDLFDFWQANLSKVITVNQLLLDRLASMEATYIVGNHDSDLLYFINTGFLNHPFFCRMCRQMTLTVGGRKFLIVHGHEADPYCKSDVPDMGRITAIASGLLEDKQGGPVTSDGTVVEDHFIGHLEQLAGWYNRIKGSSVDRNVELNNNIRTLKNECNVDVIVAGHTHLPGRIGTWSYNSGSWARTVDSFVCIESSGQTDVFDWPGPVLNKMELPFKE